MQWSEKYRPKVFSDFKGQSEAIEIIKRFVAEFNMGKLTRTRKKALLLHGPPGTGKTTLAHITAKENNLEIFELNASDLRNKSKLHEILRPAMEQQSLTQKGKIVLVDEVDGISAVDRGGLSELIVLIELTPYPVVITANDAWSKKLSALRKKSDLVQLKEITYSEIKDVMINILRKESLFIANDVLTNIAVKAKGDIRAAINDLQAISQLKDPSKVEFDERNKQGDIFSVLRLILKGKPTDELLSIFYSLKMPLDEVLLWLEENIPSEYRGKELERAYDLLSKADLFKGRIYKQQYWRFLVYENAFLGYGISASKKQIKTGFTSYKKPTRILKIWLNNQRVAKKKSIANKYARHVHVGEKRALSEFAIIRQIITNNPEVQEELKLSEEEISYLERPLIEK